jgi:hypothetical protein
MDLVIELNRIADGIPDVHEFGAASELLARLKDRLKKPVTSTGGKAFASLIDRNLTRPMTATKAAQKISGGMFKKDYQA